MRLRSFKLRFRDRYAWIVPATDAAGCPFAGPGVTLRGEPAAEALALAAPITAALSAFEPGIQVRSLSIDLERPRVLATLEPLTPEADPRGRVVRLDAGPALSAVTGAAAPLVAFLAARAVAALARRPREG